MRTKKSNARSWHYGRSNGSSPNQFTSISNWKLGSLLAGVLFAVTFGCMFMYAAVMF